MPDSPTSAAQTFRLLPLGDAAVTVEFGNEIDPALNEWVIAFADRLHAQNWKGIRDVVPTYRSVTIHVDPLCLEVTTLTDRLHRLSYPVSHSSTTLGMQHRIPVVYGGEWGPDLEDVAAFARMSVADAIRLHASVVYRV